MIDPRNYVIGSLAFENGVQRKHDAVSWRTVCDVPLFVQLVHSERPIQGKRMRTGRLLTIRSHHEDIKLTGELLVQGIDAFRPITIIIGQEYARCPGHCLS